MKQVGPERIAFIGVGNMGWPMAANLVRAGYDVTVADRDAARVAAFLAEHGGAGEADAAVAARGRDVVITILPTSKQVAEVAVAVKPVLAPGALFMDMTSGQPGATRAIAAELAAAGIGMVDCPVSGDRKSVV